MNEPILISYLLRALIILNRILYNPWLHILGWLLRIFLELKLAPDFLVSEKGYYVNVAIHYGYTIAQFYFMVLVFLPWLVKPFNAHVFWKAPLLIFAEWLIVMLVLIVGSVYLGGLEFNFRWGAPFLMDIWNIKGVLAPWLTYLPLSVLFFAVLKSVTIGIHALKAAQAEHEQANKLQHLLLTADLTPHLFLNTFTVIRGLQAERIPYTICTNAIRILQYYLEVKGTVEVPLKEELEQCEILLAIQRVRLQDKMYVRLLAPAKLENMQIVPMSVFALLDNIFKHGVCEDPALPAEVKVYVDDGKLIVMARNYVSKRSLPGTQIGHANLKDRLTACYGTDYTWTERLTTNEFMIILEINLQPEPTE